MKLTLMSMATAVFMAVLCAEADAAFRCPNGNLVDTGDSIAIVTTKCDPPASVTKTVIPIETEKGRIAYIENQEWVYTAGSSLIHVLNFSNGILVSINTGGFTR